MTNMSTLTCYDRYGSKVDFQYRSQIEHLSDPEKRTFRVETVPSLPCGATFELTVEVIDESSVQVITMAHHKVSEYVAKGIPDALIPHIADTFRVTVRSSSNFKQPGVFRTDDASKVWKRIVRNGRAEFLDDQDTYVCMPVPSSDGE